LSAFDHLFKSTASGEIDDEIGYTCNQEESFFMFHYIPNSLPHCFSNLKKISYLLFHEIVFSSL